MKNKILVIDNYDSFTYNLVHYLEDLDCDVEVFRNDMIDINHVNNFDKILLSPGPGIPDEAGLLKSIISKYINLHSLDDGNFISNAIRRMTSNLFLKPWMGTFIFCFFLWLIYDVSTKDCSPGWCCLVGMVLVL